MKKAFLVVPAVILAASGAVPASADSPVSVHESTGTVPRLIPEIHDHRARHILYNQSANGSLIGITSQVFERALRADDSQGADDFTVPVGSTWTISEVDVYGQYFNDDHPLARSENVFFYAIGENGLPGALIQEFHKVKGLDYAGSFGITLPKKGIILTAGTYFVSVSINMDFDDGEVGEWGWNTTNAGGPTFGNPAVWENPGDGYHTGCTIYMVDTVCQPVGQGSDFLFTIRGSSK